MKLAVSHRQIGWNVLWTLVLLLMALAPPHGYALDPAKSLFQYNCQTWRRQSGLPANGVNAIAQSKDGYLWLGTPNGLVRFDGSDFTLLDLGQSPGLRSRVATGLSTSSRGGFWFGLERSAFGYCDGAGVSLLGQEAWGGANLNVHSVLETREGDLWVAAETLAARLSQQTRFDIILNTPDSQSVLRFDVTALYQDALGRVWLGTARRGLFYWLNGILTRFPDPALDDLTIRSLAEDRRGRLWVGTDLGLLCYDAAFARQPLPFPWHPTRALLADAQGALWAGTSGGGLVRFLDGAPTQLRRADGLADDFVMALAEDKEGCLWVGTRNGLSQLSDVKFPTFGKAEGLTAEVNVAVCASRQGGLWVATSQGFTHFDGAAHHYSADIGLRHPYINGIFRGQGRRPLSHQRRHGHRGVRPRKNRGPLSQSNLATHPGGGRPGGRGGGGRGPFPRGHEFLRPLSLRGRPETAHLLDMASGRGARRFPLGRQRSRYLPGQGRRLYPVEQGQRLGGRQGALGL